MNHVNKIKHSNTFLLCLEQQKLDKVMASLEHPHMSDSEKICLDLIKRHRVLNFGVYSEI
jgi:hypothetical protein